MIKEEYANIPEDQFVPLTCVDDCFLGKYEINKIGQIKNTITGKILNPSFDRYFYLLLSGRTKDNKVKRSTAQIHRVLAKTFLVNVDPKTKNLVDHIDGNRRNNQLSNLRWVTPSENAKNRRKTERKNQLIFRKYNKNEKLLEEVDKNNLSNSFYRAMLKGFRKSNSNRIEFNGFLWEMIDKEVEEYLKQFGKTISDLVFVESSISPKSLVSREGVIKHTRTGKLSLGSKTFGGYKQTRIANVPNLLVHRVIYETFSGIKLKSTDIIDHIDGNRENNSFDNLRVGTQADNLRNPVTRKKRYRKVNQYDLSGNFVRTFDSIWEAAESVNTISQRITRCCSGGRSKCKGYKWIYADQDPNTPEYHKNQNNNETTTDIQ